MCAWIRAAQVTIGIVIRTTRANEQSSRTVEAKASAVPA
jgi:hypothetical protein